MARRLRLVASINSFCTRISLVEAFTVPKCRKVAGYLVLAASYDRRSDEISLNEVEKISI
jgi:hypothetical protein